MLQAQSNVNEFDFTPPDNVQTALLNANDQFLTNDSANSFDDSTPNHSPFEIQKPVTIKNHKFDNNSKGVGIRSCGGPPLKTVYSN